MPFRQFYRDRGANHPVAYSIITLALGMLACMAISVIISVSLFQQSRERERQQQEKNRAATCMVIDRMRAVYQQAETEVGRDAFQSWNALAIQFGCRKG